MLFYSILLVFLTLVSFQLASNTITDLILKFTLILHSSCFTSLHLWTIFSFLLPWLQSWVETGGRVQSQLLHTWLEAHSWWGFLGDYLQHDRLSQAAQLDLCCHGNHEGNLYFFSRLVFIILQVSQWFVQIWFAFAYKLINYSLNLLGSLFILILLIRIVKSFICIEGKVTCHLQ